MMFVISSYTNTFAQNGIKNLAVVTPAFVSDCLETTIEIAEEDDEHQFFFSASSALNLVVAYADQDGNGQPLGLLSTITAGGASNGTLTITLRHEPNKSAAGVSDGDISNAGGETDIEVLFPITIVQ